MKSFFHKLLAVKFVVILGLLVGILFIAGSASAHQTITVGDFDVEYGWLNEPPIEGQPNAVVINVSSSTAEFSDIDVLGLQVQAVFGSETKDLTLQPLGEDTQGQFIAPITPMLTGVYTVHLEGSIGTTAFNIDVQPEEVQTADVVQFPVPTPAQTSSSSGSLGTAGWLAIAGIVLGAVGIGIGLVALSRKST